jgi:hypothetical protein
MLDMATWYRTETGRTKETTNFTREDDDFDRRPVTYFMNDFDGSYDTGSPAYTGAKAGYPAGDLNWFPERKTAWENDPAATAVEQISAEVPSGYRLDQNYPNPFNPTTNIAYALPRQATVSLAVYNILGQEVATLVDHLEQAAGTYNVTWNGVNAAGESVATGLYLYRLDANGTVITKKMILLK